MLDSEQVSEGPLPAHYPAAPMPSDLASRPITFGRCSAYPSARTLLLNGHPVDLGGRAFDLLMVLLSSRGQVVAKQTIIGYVWPTTIVDESNLRFQMAVLRKALGADRSLIKTIPGRGYMVTDEAFAASYPIKSSEANEMTDDGSGSRQLCQALRLLIHVFERHPLALHSVEALLSRSAFERTEHTRCSDSPA